MENPVSWEWQGHYTHELMAEKDQTSQSFRMDGKSLRSPTPIYWVAIDKLGVAGIGRYSFLQEYGSL